MTHALLSQLRVILRWQICIALAAAICTLLRGMG